MSAKQWKPILVIFDLLRGQFPTLHGVALSAIRAHLTAMDIRVTVRAVLAHVGKNRLNVALNAFHFFMQTAQGILRFIVIKLGNGANGAPAGRGVAVLAGNVDRAMRIARSLVLSSRKCLSGARGGVRSGQARNRNSKQSPKGELEQSERIVLPPSTTVSVAGAVLQNSSIFKLG